MAEGSEEGGRGKATALLPEQLEQLADMVAARLAKNPLHTTETVPNPDGNEGL